MVTLNKRSLIYAQDSHQSLNYLLIESKKDDFYPEKYDEDDKDWKRLRSRRLYDPVFHATNTHTGFISQASIDKRIENKKNNKKHQPCYDHVTTPQFLLRFLVDCKPDIFNISKEGFNEFLYWFELATSVIEVTNPENTLVRQFTKFRNGNYQIFESSDKKYKKAGIKLCERPVGVTSWIKSIPTNRVFVFRDEFLDYEREFIK